MVEIGAYKPTYETHFYFGLVFLGGGGKKHAEMVPLLLTTPLVWNENVN